MYQTCCLPTYGQETVAIWVSSCAGHETVTSFPPGPVHLKIQQTSRTLRSKEVEQAVENACAYVICVCRFDMYVLYCIMRIIYIIHIYINIHDVLISDMRHACICLQYNTVCICFHILYIIIYICIYLGIHVIQYIYIYYYIYICVYAYIHSMQYIHFSLLQVHLVWGCKHPDCCLWPRF